MKKTYVISLGGSIIIPEQIDTKFLKQFIALLKNRVTAGDRFILVTGGGIVARSYNKALASLAKVTSRELDWMGIAATHLNATLLRLALGKLAYPKTVVDASARVPFKQAVLVAGGWKPGWSTDYVACKLAYLYGAQTIINLSNIDYLYEKDPRKFPDAKRIEQISWAELQKIVGTKWKPGANVPFDPIASRFAGLHSQTVIIANGRNIKNLAAILSGRPAKGTVIR